MEQRLTSGIRIKSFPSLDEGQKISFCQIVMAVYIDYAGYGLHTRKQFDVFIIGLSGPLLSVVHHGGKSIPAIV